MDCTTQVKVCNQFNIRSYPTTVFFNGSKPHYYHGEHSADALSEFVHEVLNPSVITLDEVGFHQKVQGKPENEVWLIDFYAPCKPIAKALFVLIKNN